MSRLTDSVGERRVAKKVREVILILEAHGWRQVRERGSHVQFRHPARGAVVTVAGKRSDTMPVGQLASIRRKSGIEDLR
jgi:predicted RNA binding protein YcfA (HicA-like mRNA interferase family)